MSEMKKELQALGLFTADEIDQKIATLSKIEEIQSKIDQLTDELVELSEKNAVPFRHYFGDINFAYMPESLNSLDEQSKEDIAEIFEMTYLDDFVGCWYSSYDMR